MPIFVRLGAARFRESVWEILPSKRANRLGKNIKMMELTSKKILQTSKRRLAEDSLHDDPDMSQDLISILCSYISTSGTLGAH